MGELVPREIHFGWRLAPSEYSSVTRGAHGSLDSIAHRPTRARVCVFACVHTHVGMHDDHVREKSSLCRTALDYSYAIHQPAFMVKACVLCWLHVCACIPDTYTRQYHKYDTYTHTRAVIGQWRVCDAEFMQIDKWDETRSWRQMDYRDLWGPSDIDFESPTGDGFTVGSRAFSARTTVSVSPTYP